MSNGVEKKERNIDHIFYPNSESIKRQMVIVSIWSPILKTSRYNIRLNDSHTYSSFIGHSLNKL